MSNRELSGLLILTRVYRAVVRDDEARRADLKSKLEQNVMEPVKVRFRLRGCDHLHAEDVGVDEDAPRKVACERAAHGALPHAHRTRYTEVPDEFHGGSSTALA